MKGFLFGGLAVAAVLIGGTIAAVFRQADRSYHDAVDRCHDAGGAWVASGPRSYSGTCLRGPGPRQPPP